LRKADDYVDNEVSPAEVALSFPRVSRKSTAYDGNIEKIDVKCDTSNGMIVEVEFAEIFNGVIYSQGYYNDPKCRYVSAGSNERRFVFKVPFDGCGSKPSCSICASVDNILIIQNDQDIQESWDTARKITCSRSDEQEKTVYFRPFVVDMLEVISSPIVSQERFAPQQRQRHQGAIRARLIPVVLKSQRQQSHLTAILDHEILVVNWNPLQHRSQNAIQDRPILIVSQRLTFHQLHDVHQSLHSVLLAKDDICTELLSWITRSSLPTGAHNDTKAPLSSWINRSGLPASYVSASNYKKSTYNYDEAKVLSRLN
ncbi:hypothetical protein AWZ03_011481, partial [Drosophila navojoa]